MNSTFCQHIAFVFHITLTTVMYSTTLNDVHYGEGVRYELNL